MYRWIWNYWRRRQRQIDLEILWPACLKLGRDLDHAKAAFAVHAFHDPAWLCLGEAEIYRIIDHLQER